MRNHAHAMVACDFFVTVTARFRLVYVLVALDVGTRRIVHWNVTEHPSAAWTIQQLRMLVPGDEPHRFVIHDRDRIFSPAVDQWLTDAGVTVLKTPPRAPQANAYCERLIGTIRRECLDWVIPLNMRHLRHVLTEWTAHYNHTRPHSSLGPGIPDLHPRDGGPDWSRRHSIPAQLRVVADPILGGLHHEYRLERAA